ncbi:MAG: hypothetical protein QN157_08425 [Armatimonadota bacterium]|nr:hypothetical protein [Armatimonadota bacterium]
MSPIERTRLSGTDLRHLLQLRRRLRDEIVAIPRDLLREVLYALEQTRRWRYQPSPPPWAPAEMSRGELLRELKWRLDVAALPELVAAARVLDRIQQTRRRARSWARGRRR